MDWMIALIMLIAVSVIRLTVYGGVNGVGVANFYQHMKKLLQSRIHVEE